MLFKFNTYSKTAISLFFIMIVVAACSKEEGKADNIEKVVVEGYLVEGQPLTVKITRMLPYESRDTTKYLDNLSVVIKEGISTFLLNGLGNGEYFLPASSLVVEVGKTYSLEFTYKGNRISASTIIPSKPENFTTSRATMKVPRTINGPSDLPNPIECKWRNSTGEYYLVSAMSYDPNPDPLNLFGSAGSGFTFRSEPIQSNSYDLPFPSFSYLGNHHIILFHVQDDYAALYKNSGTSSLNITNLNTTVKNGLGIFTGISADTLNLYLYK